MINLILGAPGGGKSYEAVVYHVLAALEAGRKVVTNLPLVVEQFAAIDPAFGGLIELRTTARAPLGRWEPGGEGAAFKVEPGRQPGNTAKRAFSGVWCYFDTWTHPQSGQGPLYVIDECHLAMPRGGTEKAVEEWYSLHRHYRADVLLMTQSYGKVSKDVCDLVQLVYRVRKNVALGSTKTYTRKVQDGLRGEVMNTAIRSYKPQFFKLYRSHTQGDAGTEAGAQDVRPIWKHWSFIGAAILIPSSLIALGSGSAGNPLEPAAAKATHKPLIHKAQNNQAVAVKAPEVPASSQPQQERLSDIEPFSGRGLHLTGSITMGGRTVYTFVLSQNAQHVASLTSEDLRASGYEWRSLGDCAGELAHGKSVRMVICDAPQVSLGVGPKAQGGARLREAPAPQDGPQEAGAV